MAETEAGLVYVALHLLDRHMVVNASVYAPVLRTHIAVLVLCCRDEVYRVILYRKSLYELEVCYSYIYNANMINIFDIDKCFKTQSTDCQDVLSRFVCILIFYFSSNSSFVKSGVILLYHL